MGDAVDKITFKMDESDEVRKENSPPLTHQPKLVINTTHSQSKI